MVLTYWTLHHKVLFLTKFGLVKNLSSCPQVNTLNPPTPLPPLSTLAQFCRIKQYEKAVVQISSCMHCAMLT